MSRSLEEANTHPRFLFLPSLNPVVSKCWGTEPKAVKSENRFFEEDHMTLDLLKA
jgi:hypothetical protein